MAASDSLETFETLTGLSGPVYFRKIPRRSHWGTNVDSIDQRVSKTVGHLFKEENSVFSFFLAKTVEDLARIAFGLNSTRSMGSMKEQIDFVSFSESEFNSTGVVVAGTKGATSCDGANMLHVDVSADIKKLEQLCRIAMEQNRIAGRLSESWMKKQLDSPKFAECHAVTGISNRCECVVNYTRSIF